MSQVTPKVGQVWERLRYNACVSSLKVGSEIKVESIDNGKVWYLGTSSLTLARFQEEYRFVPQTDLEWLAVHVEDCPFNPAEKIARSYNLKGYCFVRARDAASFKNTYTRNQLLQCRIDLGLDTKEKEMLKLTKADVGKEFDLDNGDFCRVVIVGCHDVVIEHYCCHRVASLSGELYDTASSLRLTHRHDSRHWLKDLPDADIFEDDIYLYCSNNYNWCFSKYSKSIHQDGNCWEGNLLCFDGIKMPKLTGDEWKDSKISIEQLREYQEQNK